VTTQEPTADTPPDFAQGPASVCPRESTVNLFTAIRELLTDRGLPEVPARLITCFVFATWFHDSLPAAPCLLITGPRPEGHFVLELLACLVRNPFPIFELTRGGFLNLDMKAEYTLLIHQERITTSAWNLLRASNHRNAQISSRHGLRKIYCAKAIYCGIEAGGDGDDMVRIDLPPSRGPLPILNAKDKQAIAEELQPKMRYR
jgi:hypothetical protein